MEFRTITEIRENVIIIIIIIIYPLLQSDITVIDWYVVFKLFYK
jgi:hypothetical protein